MVHAEWVEDDPEGMAAKRAGYRVAALMLAGAACALCLLVAQVSGPRWEEEDARPACAAWLPRSPGDADRSQAATDRRCAADQSGPSSQSAQVMLAPFARR